MPPMIHRDIKIRTCTHKYINFKTTCLKPHTPPPPKKKLRNEVLWELLWVLKKTGVFTAQFPERKKGVNE